MIDTLITEIYTSLLFGQRALWTTMHNLIQSLSAYDQKATFDTILRDLARKFLQGGVNGIGHHDSLMSNASTISGVAAMISRLTQNNALLEEHVVHWLTNTSGEYVGLSLEMRRAVIATLATSQGKSGTPCGCSTLTTIRQARAHPRDDSGGFREQIADPAWCYPSAGV